MWKLFLMLKFSLEQIWFYLVQYFKAMGFLFFCVSTLSLKWSIILVLIPRIAKGLFFDAYLVQSYKLVLTAITGFIKWLKGQEWGQQTDFEFNRWVNRWVE